MAKKTDRVVERDGQGRPIDVYFDGDPALQCPGCLGMNVRPEGAIGFLPAGNELLIGDSAFSPVRHMRCSDCGAGWMRPGL